jgi:hypothetical protein
LKTDRFTIKANELLIRLRQRILEDFEASDQLSLQHIGNKTGNPAACVTALAGDTLTRGIVDWFDTHDIKQLRQYFYVSALLQKHYYEMLASNDDDFKLREARRNPFIRQYDLFTPLVCNHPELIQWYARSDHFYDSEKVENQKKWDFYAYHSIIAMRGDWARLKARCEQAMSDPPADKTWYEYNALYYALAKQDKAEIERELVEIVAPARMRKRLGEEPIYTEHFFLSRIIIFMKIAWLHGLEVQLDHFYVPMEFMPMTPNTHYDKHYSFLK